MADAASSQVAVLAPEEEGGGLTGIPADRLDEALQSGYSRASQADIDAAKFKAEHDSPAKAFGLGALSGATFGAGNEALNKLGLSTPESQAAYRAAHPHLFSGGQFIGSIAPIVGAEAITGGAATAAAPELLAGEAAADALPAAGEIAEPIAARAAAGAPGAVSASAEAKAAGTVADAAQASTEAAAEAAAPPPGPGTLGHLAKDFGIGAGLSAGNQVTEDALGDNHALDGEVLVPAMLSGGAMASVAGLGLRGAAKVLTPALRRATDAVGSTADALSDFLAGRAVKQGAEDGIDESALKMATEDPVSATDPKALAAEKALQLSQKQNLGKELYGKVDDVMDAMRSNGKDFHKNIRPDAAVNLLASHDLDAVRGSAQDLIESQQATIDKLGALKDPDGRSLVSSTTLGAAKDALDKADTAVQKAERSGDVFNAMNDYKRVQAKLGQFNKMAMGTNQEETIQGMRALADSATKHLEDSGVYGDMAGLQQEINSAETRSITAQRQILKTFGRVEETAAGRTVRVLDEDKFKAAANAWAAGKKSASLTHLGNLLDSADNLNKVYANVLEKVPGKEMQLQAGDVKQLLDAALESKQQTMEQAGLLAKRAPVGPATAYQSIGGKLGTPAEYDKGIMGIGESGMMMAGAHMLGVPAPLLGAAAMARGTLSAMRGELLPPAATVKVLAMIAKAKNSFASASDTAISAMLKHGGKAGVLVPIIGEHISRGPQDFQLGDKSHAGMSDAESFRQHAMDIQAQAAQPAGQAPNNPLLTGAPLIGSQALAAHQRALGVMAKALPPGSAMAEHEQQALLFSRPGPTSPLDRQDFVNSAGIVHDPLIVMPLMQSGLLTSKTVATMKQAYPAIYGSLSQKLLTELADLSPKERARLSPGLVDSMSTFLGIPLSNLQQPQTLLLSQKAGMTQAPPAGPAMPKRPKKTVDMKSAARAQTPNQAADAVLRDQ